MSFYTFDSDFQTVDAHEIWDRMVKHVETNNEFRSVSSRKTYKAKLDNGNIAYVKNASRTETLSKEKTLSAIDTVRLLSTLNTNTVRPYLRQANFPVHQCLPFMGLLLSAEVLVKDR